MDPPIRHLSQVKLTTVEEELGEGIFRSHRKFFYTIAPLCFVIFLIVMASVLIPLIIILPKGGYAAFYLLNCYKTPQMDSCALRNCRNRTATDSDYFHPGNITANSPFIGLFAGHTFSVTMNGSLLYINHEYISKYKGNETKTFVSREFKGYGQEGTVYDFYESEENQYSIYWRACCCNR